MLETGDAAGPRDCPISPTFSSPLSSAVAGAVVDGWGGGLAPPAPAPPAGGGPSLRRSCCTHGRAYSVWRAAPMAAAGLLVVAFVVALVAGGCSFPA